MINSIVLFDEAGDIYGMIFGIIKEIKRESWGEADACRRRNKMFSFAGSGQAAMSVACETRRIELLFAGNDHERRPRRKPPLLRLSPCARSVAPRSQSIFGKVVVVGTPPES